MKILKRIFLIIIFLAIILTTYSNEKILANTNNDVVIKDTLENEIISTKIGIGGGGALFEPKISPHNSNEMLVVPDMGGIYISHDKGLNWDRVNLHGTVSMGVYDPNREGVIYAGGSGLWRSTDNGNTFELIFPNKNDITAKRLHNSNSLQYYFTKSGIYDNQKYIEDILIDPEDSNHIFALGYSYKNGIVYESKDNGENFERIFTYTKSTSPTIQFDFNELIYRRETKDIFAIYDEGMTQYNLETKQTTVIPSEIEIMDVSTVFENGKTYFIIIEKTNDLENSETVVYYTNDFINKTYITDVVTSAKPTSFEYAGYGQVTYKYKFRYVSATSLNNIYLAMYNYAESSSIKDFPYTIDGIIRYHDGKAEYLYGNPFRDHNYLSGRSWNDGCTYSLGISASMQNEDEFIFTTLNGVYYSEDNIHIYARHTTLTEGTYPNAKFVTNGIDEQKTYAVCEDPFNEGVMLLLNTDLGLIRSEDNGENWSWIYSGIPRAWQNTIYDAEFDQRREGIVYSLWSGRHNAPYNAKNETDGRNGGFAISFDGGKTWDATYSSGIPSHATPVEMSVVYQENSDEVTIYVATFNCGFFVSVDSGKTFTEINNGIEKIEYKEDEKYHYIFAQDIEVKDGHIFGLTAKTTYNSSTQPGELFEFDGDTWVKIPLPDKITRPADIYYYNGKLYVCTYVESIWDGKNGATFNSYYGGVYEYKDGAFTQIFDDSISATSVVFDSKGTMYISDMEGNIYRKEKDATEYQKIYADYHYISDSLQITDDDDRLYLASHGGGMLKLENLNSFYDKEETKIDFNMVSNKAEVVSGEEFSMTVSVNNVSEIEEGIVALMGTLDYDSSVLEIVEKDGEALEGKNKWNFDYYENKDFKFIADNNVVSTNGEIFTITFKAKENLETQKTRITIKDFVASGGEKVIESEDKTLELNIVKKPEEVLVGDIDKNGEVNINDLAKLKLHLIGKEIITEADRLDAADVDRDGKITVNDLAKLKLILIESK